MDDSANKSLSYFNLNDRGRLESLKRTILNKTNRQYISPLMGGRTSNSKNFYLCQIPNVSSTSRKNHRCINELNLTKFDRKDRVFHNSLEKGLIILNKTNSFLEKPKKCLNMKETFKISLEKSYSFLIEIMNRRWEDEENLINLEDSEEILKNINIQKERVTKLSLLHDGIFDYMSKLSLFNEYQEIFESIKLAFCEYNKVIELFQSWLINICMKTEQNKKMLENKKNADIFNLQNNYDIVIDIINLILRINQKKQLEIDNPGLNIDFEKDWHYKLNELKSKFNKDFSNSKFTTAIKSVENFIGELFNKISQLKKENDLLVLDNNNFMKSFDNSNTLTLKTTMEVLKLRNEQSANIQSFDPNVQISLDYLKKYEEIYIKSIEDLKSKNLELENEISKFNSKFHGSSSEIMTHSKVKKNKNSLITKKNKETQINYIRFEDLPENKSYSTNNFLKIALKSLNAGFNMPNASIYSFINIILSNKIIYDYQSFNELRPYQSLHDFSLQWFLSKFGNQIYAHLLMKDFFANTLKNMKNSERCQTFNHLCDLQDESNQEQEDFSSIFLSSKKALIIYLKLSNFVNLHIKDNENQLLSPFFPINESITLSIEEAIKAIEYIGNEEISDIVIIQEIIKQFYESVEKKKIKLIEKKISKRKNSILLGEGTSNQNDKNKYINICISFDVLAKFLLETISLNFERKIDDIVNTMKVIQSNRKNNDFFSEDFNKIVSKNFPSKSQSFIDECFMEFIYGNSQHSISAIKDLMKKAAYKLCETSCYKSFYIDFDENKPPIYYKEKYYDFVSSIIIIMYLYESIVEKIKNEEIKNDNIYILHEQFKKEIMRFPKNTENLNRINTLFSGNDKKEITEKVENIWKIYRSMVDILFSKSENALILH